MVVYYYSLATIDFVPQQTQHEAAIRYFTGWTQNKNINFKD